MVRKLKFHEKKLLKKVDFINWEVDNNLHEVKVMRKPNVKKHVTIIHHSFRITQSVANG